MALVYIVTLTSVQNVLCLTRAKNVSVLVSLQLHPLTGPRRSWERGLEILPGALLAVSDINNDSTILPGYNLQLMIADSGRDKTEIVEQFINLAFYHEMHKKNLVSYMDTTCNLQLLIVEEMEKRLCSNFLTLHFTGRCTKT